jgi:predicted nucleic acid-binding protein
VDASAIVKLIVTEVESAALSTYLRSAGRLATNRVAVVEVARAARRRLGEQPDALAAALASFVVVELDAPLADRAATIGPAGLRPLDAIHLASAMELGGDLAAFVTYDARLSAAASSLGIAVVAPGATNEDASTRTRTGS